MNVELSLRKDTELQQGFHKQGGSFSVRTVIQKLQRKQKRSKTMTEIKLKQKDYEAIIKNMDNELIIAKSIIRDLLKLNNDKFGQTKMDWRISVVENAEAFLKE